MWHRRPFVIDVAAEVEPVVDRSHAALVHAIDRPRRADRRFDLPVLRHDSTDLRQRRGIVGEELAGEHPVEDPDVPRRGLPGGEAVNGAAEPVGHRVPGFPFGRRQRPVEERLEQREIGKRGAGLVVGDETGDAEPALFSDAVIGGRQRHAAGGGKPRARWKVGIEVGRGKLSEHSRNAVFQRRE